MIQLRKSQARGHFDHGWLNTYHTFSFGDYYDPNFMGFGSLRVINEDFVAGGKGFPTHGHRDMEIITYPIQGVIAHKDSTGTSGVIEPYEVQKMSAGKGILHSEFNNSPSEVLHLLQIWLIPNATDLEPSYEQRDFRAAINSGNPTLLASPSAMNDSIKVHQDVFLWARKLASQQNWELELKSNRYYWIQLVRGALALEASSQTASQGDGIALSNESRLKITATTETELLLFDMG
jgi:redox-sensitive bicupin YhaK (pirin superfamily)